MSFFFVLLAAAAPPVPSSDDEHGTWRYTHSYFKRSLVRATGARSVCVASSPHLSRVAVTGLPRMEVGNFFSRYHLEACCCHRILLAVPCTSRGSSAHLNAASGSQQARETTFMYRS